jgi:outer membrane receptor protein involved in Fe transport
MCLATPNQTYGVNSMDEVSGSYQRRNEFIHVTYDLTENVQLYGEGNFARDTANVKWQSVSLLDSWAAPVSIDNPFLAPNVRTQIQNALEAAFPNATGPLSAANGYGPGYRYVYPTHSDFAAQYFTYGAYLENDPGNPLGVSRQLTSNNTDQGTLGIKANVGDWKIEGYYSQGSTIQDYVDADGTRVDRLFFAMDAITGPNGSPMCRVASQQYDPQYYKSFQDCVPINLFGGWNNISPQAAQYVSGTNKVAKQYYDFQNAELSANGKLFDGFGAGPISGAFGVSWRKESVFETTPDPSDEYPAFLNGQLVSSVIPTQAATFRGVIPYGFYINQFGYTQPWPASAATAPNPFANNGQLTGGIPGLYFAAPGFVGDNAGASVLFSAERTFGGETSVREAFSEFNIPLLKNLPFFESLSTDIAGRYADYSGSGTVWAWKFGLDWAINDTVRLRVTRSRDVRAASLEERFDTTPGGVTVNNPWVLTNGQPTLQSAESFSGGNPNLAPEKANTLTAGVVFTPTFLPGFSASVDWYKITIADAIDKPTAQEVVDAAFAGDPQYVALVKLDGNNNIVQVGSTFINFAQQFINGVDFEAAYRRSFVVFGAPGQAAIRLYASDLAKNATLTQFGTYDEWAGQVGTGRSLPKQKYTLNVSYNTGPYAAFVQGRYISSGILDHTLVQSDVAIPGVQTINDNHVPGVFYMDLNFTYTVPVPGDLTLWAEVNNVLDRAPPETPGAFGRTGAGGLNYELYDILGRRYTIGLRYKF